MSQKKIKVIMAKIGLDGHDRGARMVSKFLRDAGMEVIYTGPLQTAESVVQTAIEEDGDIIGLSFLSGGHLNHTAEIIKILQEKNMKDDFLIIVGGVIPQKDIPALKEMGVEGVFPPGSRMKDIEDHIRRFYN